MSLHLVLGSALGLALVQGALLILARGLGLRLRRAPVLIGLVLAGLLITGFALSGRVFFPTNVISRSLPDGPMSTAAENYRVLNDAVYQFIPWELEVRRAFGSGRLPLWSDRLDGGSSPWVNPQAGALSPIAVVARLVPIPSHLLLALALKILVAFQGTWLLARLFGSRRVFALIGGVGFALGGGIVAWSLFPHSATAAWMPWLAAGTIVVVRRRKPRAIAATAVITAFMLLSGHPETAIGGGLLAVVCAASYWRRSEGLRGLSLGVGAASIAAVLGFALAAPHIVPFAVHLPDTVRYHRMSDGGEAPRIPDTIINAQRARLLKRVISPRPGGELPYSSGGFLPLAGGGYAGLVALAGTFIIAASRKRRCWPLILFGLIIFLLILDFLPLVAVTFRLPVVQTIGWTRLITTVPLCLAVCGAMGLSEMVRHRKKIALVAISVAAIANLTAGPQPVVIALWLGILGSAALILWRPRVGIAALIVVAFADLVPWAVAMQPKGDPDLFYPETPFVASLTREVESRGGCRVVGGARNTYPSLLSVYGLDDIRYHNPVADHAYAQVLDRLFGFHPESRAYEYMSPIRHYPRFLEFLNVGLVITGGAKVPPRFTTAFTAENGPRRALANPRILPRAFLPRDVVAADESEVLEAVVDNPDPRVVVLSSKAASTLDLPPAHWWPVAVTSSTDSMGRVSMTVRRKGERLVATSLTHPSGWTAAADDLELRTVTVNHAFLGVVVPDGVRDVELVYVPPGFHIGVLSGIIGLLGTALVVRRHG